MIASFSARSTNSLNFYRYKMYGGRGDRTPDLTGMNRTL